MNLNKDLINVDLFLLKWQECMMKKFLKWTVIVIVALFILGAIFGGDKDGEGASTSASSTEPETPAIEVSANELLKAYNDNEVGANAKYKGKVLLINATVDSISADFNDDPFLVLKAGGQYEFSQPQAHLVKSEHDKAAELKKGQKITLKCIGNSEIAGTPMLDKCVIQ